MCSCALLGKRAWLTAKASALQAEAQQHCLSNLQTVCVQLRQEYRTRGNLPPLACCHLCTQVGVGNVDYPAVIASKTPVLRKAAERLLKDDKFKGLRDEMSTFR